MNLLIEMLKLRVKIMEELLEKKSEAKEDKSKPIL